MTDTYDDLCICFGSKSGSHCWHETNTLVGSPDGKAHKWCVCCNCGFITTRPMPIGTLPQHDAPHGEFAPVEADPGQWKAARGALLDFGDVGDLSALPKASQGVIFVEADPNGGSPFVSKWRSMESGERPDPSLWVLTQTRLGNHIVMRWRADAQAFEDGEGCLVDADSVVAWACILPWEGK